MGLVGSGMVHSFHFMQQQSLMQLCATCTCRCSHPMLMRESKIKMAKVGQNLLHPPARPLSSYAPVPVPVTQLEHYFFTRVSTETMSGLPGIMGESALRVQCELHSPLFNHLFICEASS